MHRDIKRLRCLIGILDAQGDTLVRQGPSFSKKMSPVYTYKVLARVLIDGHISREQLLCITKRKHSHIL